MVCAVQRNLAKSEASVTELEAKLKHEQEKFQSYGEDLKHAEARCGLDMFFVITSSLGPSALGCPSQASRAIWSFSIWPRSPVRSKWHAPPHLSHLWERPPAAASLDLVCLHCQVSWHRVCTGGRQAGCCQLKHSAEHTSLSPAMLHL